MPAKTGTVPTWLPERSKLAALRSPAKLLRQSRRRLEEAQRSATSAETKAESLAAEVATALATRGQSELNAALDAAGNLVSHLRRRLQVEQRLEQLGRYQAELEERTRELVDRQPLPLGMIVAVGAVFVLGVTLVPGRVVHAGLGCRPRGLGAGACRAWPPRTAAFGKLMLERSAVRRLEDLSETTCPASLAGPAGQGRLRGPGCQVARRGRFH